MKRILFIMAALVLVLAMVPATGVVALEPGVEVVGNIAFVPNSGEASVSRVDLESPYTELARYYTAPRLGDNGNTIAPYDWRTSRIAMDSGDNAWVLNTGADGTNLQGSIVRIQGDTTGLTLTHAYPGPVLAFGTDEAVQVFPVGAAGEMPRAIAIDGDGYIWVGFYSGAQLMKYQYDPAGPSLNVVGGPFYPSLSPDNVIRYYEMKFAPDGTLFISSRGSTPARTPRLEGIWTFDPTSGEFVRETTFNPYSILIADDGTVYATAYSNLLYIRDPGTGNWTSTIVGPSDIQNRGMGFDNEGNIWIASTVGTIGGTVIYSYNVMAAAPGPTYTLTSGTTPVGVGKDAAGNMWAVCRSDAMANGWVEGFDPVSGSPVGAIEVGYRPYAYGDFTPTALVEYKLCGYKYSEWGDDMIALPLWDIVLEKYDEDLGEWGEVASVQTDAYGQYCFTGLTRGTYRISETLKDGWTQLEPAGKVHLVTLPDGATLPDADEPLYYNFVNTPKIVCYDETAWAYGEDIAEPNNKVAGNPSTAWGWTNYFAGDETFPVVMDLWAAAGQNDLDNGFKVGTVTVAYDGTCVMVTYELGDPYTLAEAHVWVGKDPLPTWQAKRGRTTTTASTAAPGQFSKYVKYTPDPVIEDQTATFVVCDVDAPFYVAAHAVVEWCEYDWEIVRLVEKDPTTWDVIAGASGVLVFAPRGPEFEFVFAATGLAAGTDYSLIYYADPWAGNNPGALIAYGTSDADGVLILEGSEDLNMNLPDPADANYADGAKIWLVPSADYNPVTNAMIAWNPTQYLFEDNLIRYYDTDIS